MRKAHGIALPKIKWFSYPNEGQDVVYGLSRGYITEDGKPKEVSRFGAEALLRIIEDLARMPYGTLRLPRLKEIATADDDELRRLSIVHTNHLILDPSWRPETSGYSLFDSGKQDSQFTASGKHLLLNPRSIEYRGVPEETVIHGEFHDPPEGIDKWSGQRYRNEDIDAKTGFIGKFCQEGDSVFWVHDRKEELYGVVASMGGRRADLESVNSKHPVIVAVDGKHRELFSD